MQPQYLGNKIGRSFPAETSRWQSPAPGHYAIYGKQPLSGCQTISLEGASLFCCCFLQSFFLWIPRPDSEGFWFSRWFSHLKLVKILFKPNIFMASSELCQAASSIIGPLYLDHLFLSTPKCAWKHGSRFHWWCDRFHETCNPHKTHKSTHKYVMQQTVQNSFQSYHDIYNYLLSNIHLQRQGHQATFFLGQGSGPSLRKGASKETPKLGGKNE